MQTTSALVHGTQDLLNQKSEYATAAGMYDQDCKNDCLKGYLELMPCMANEGFNCVSMVVDEVAAKKTCWSAGRRPMLREISKSLQQSWLQISM